MRKIALVPVALWAALAAASARAQWAVIDVAAVARLTTEVQTLEQALMTARQSLADARQRLAAMTGDRGMERLLTGVQRNYLPPDWAQLSSALDDADPAYGALGASAQQALAGDTVLTAPQFGALSGPEQAQIVSERRNAAFLQAISRQALANASGRFASLRELIGAIGTAGDQKAILDLTARIVAEQAMLENEQTKLRTLFAAARAERWADQERARERAIAAQGNFATRFRPTP